MSVTFKKATPKLIGIYRDGLFLAWLEKSARRTSGLNSTYFTFWETEISGKRVWDTSLRSVKAKIAAAVGSV